MSTWKMVFKAEVTASRIVRRIESAFCGDGRIVGSTVIGKADIIPLFLDACPGFQSSWEEHAASWNGEAAGVYNDVGEFVRYLIQAYKDGQIDCVRAAFGTLERLLVEGDSETRNILLLGFIEDLQNAASWESFGADVFIPFLGPQAQVGWVQIERMWAGKSSLADVIRAERAAGKP